MVCGDLQKMKIAIAKVNLLATVLYGINVTSSDGTYNRARGIDPEW
jgi:hypothetical protein